MRPDLSARAVDARELMDAPDADARMLERTYLRFPVVNAVVSRSGRLYRRDILPRARSRALQILDIGAGGGDLCRWLARRLRRDGCAAHVTALDADRRATRWAAAHDDDIGVDYRCAFAADLVAAGEKFDVVLSNHLLHHLTPGELQDLLADSERLVEDGGVIVHRDIARSRSAYVLFAAVTLPFARNLLGGSFIRPDGLTSIRRSYTPRELAAVAPAGWTVRRGFPARLELRREQADARS